LSSILKALKRVELQSSRSDPFFTMPKASDTKQAINSNSRRRWFRPGLITVFLVLLVIVMAAIILLSRRQPIITKKFPTGISEKQKENPASLLGKPNIFRAKIPPGSTNLTESPPEKAPLAKNQIVSISKIQNRLPPSPSPSRGRRQRLNSRCKKGPHRKIRRPPKNQSRWEASHQASLRQKPKTRTEPAPMTESTTPTLNFRHWHGSMMPPNGWQ
jgi:hypothetical protein